MSESRLVEYRVHVNVVRLVVLRGLLCGGEARAWHDDAPENEKSATIKTEADGKLLHQNFNLRC